MLRTGAGKLVLITAIGALAAGLAWWRVSAATDSRNTSAQSAEARRQDGKSIIAGVPLVPLKGLDENALVSLLSQAAVEVTPGEALVSRDAEAIIREVAGLFHVRFQQNDPDAYTAWRLARGYKFMDRSILLDASRENSTYRFCTGNLPRDDQPLDELFRDIWRCQDDKRASGARPQAIARDGQGMAVTIGDLALRGRKRVFPDLGGTLGSAWLTPPFGAFTTWFVPPQDARALVQSGQRVKSARMGIVVECDDGSRLTLHFFMVRMPDNGRWFVDTVGMTAHDTTFGFTF
jgi:hypothetical protein